jgi:uncharacterized membrane protein YbhN (UPF0104 family)
MKKLHAGLFLLGFAFLVFLIARTGIGPLWRQLTMLGWGLIPLILAEGLAEFFHAISWRYCFPVSPRSIPLARLLRIHLAGYAINFSTPGGAVAGEVAKAALLTEKSSGTEAMAAVLVGKLSMALGHLLFVILGSAILLSELRWPPALQAALMLGVVVMAAAIILFLFLQEEGKLSPVLRWLMARRLCPKRLRRFIRPLEQVDETLKVYYRERPSDFVWAVFWHLLGYSVGIFMTWYFLVLVEGHADVAAAARVWVLAVWIDLMTFVVPMNLGVLEGGRLVAFRLVGFGVLPGVSFGLVTRMAQLTWAGIGLINYALMISGKSAIRSSSRQQSCEIAQPLHD